MSIDRTWLAYVEMNPVKAKIVAFTTDYCCSSVHAHLTCHAPLEIIKPQKLLGRDLKKKKPARKERLSIVSP